MNVEFLRRKKYGISSITATNYYKAQNIEADTENNSKKI